ncbi:DUF1996 domain-containing protein [Dactylosporangium vinaceum]|uniref:DUF1996 domain-containing protein n=1 Tax=Dactylosporangium vinaceum TaxID=53362 RepID=A0ABV5MRE8_9ACTN|nr:DUF1996 domain-containing protein [Dactylosporangium vinaceum]UAB96471.1 DUF1996 domain-containing protein [Dactylosporangium vinaceum]
MAKRLTRGLLAGGAGVLALAVVAGAVYLRAGDDAAAPAAEPVSALQSGVSGSSSDGSAGLGGTSASASASSPASASPTSAKAPAAVGGWVPVDPAVWKAQVDAYAALSPDPVPAGVGNLAEFRADCQYSHSAADDPIVFPGLPGASHMHSFVGNKATNAATTPSDLTKFTATTCKPVLDHSAYWVPTLYDAATNQPVETTGFRVYYRTRMNTSTGQFPMPNGLRMIAGDAKKSVPTPRGSQGQFYCAFYGPGDLDGIARSTNGNWPICGGDATLHFMLAFPDCWDGKNLDSPNHKDHVAFGANNACPKTHPVKIPAVTFDIQYGAKGTTAGYYLSSDKQGASASSMHGDAFIMWDQTTMNKRTKNCLLQRRTCDDNGYQQ